MHLERLIWILEIVGQKGEATVAEICAHSDLPKPTAYRLVQILSALACWSLSHVGGSPLARA